MSAARYVPHRFEFAAAWLVCLATGWASAESDLEVLIAGCRQARESISTLDVELEMVPDRGHRRDPPERLGDAVQRVTWLQADKTARWQFSSDFANMRNEFLWKDDQLKLIASQGDAGKEVQSGSIAPQPRLESQTSSPWLYALFVSSELPHDFIDVALATNKYRVSVEKARRDGRDEAHVLFTEPSGLVRKEMWIAPSLNYLVTRLLIRETADGLSRIERTASKFQEVKPGIYFPTQSELVAVKQNIAIVKVTARFKRVKINDPIDPAELELRFPEGLSVADRVQNKNYLVDRDEKPVPGSEALIPLSKEEQLRLEALRPWYRRWQVWAGVAGAVVLALFAAAVIRKRRARSD